jgi:uncharacterized protein (TIGR04255 family)
MVARDAALPDTIKPDALLETIFEVRFNAPTVLTEILVAKIAEHPAWSQFQQRRLPAYQIPEAMRESQLALRFSPIFELTDGTRSVRVGPHVFSYHVNPPYPGWPQFEQELKDAVGVLFQKATDIKVHRLGMRYVNGIVPSEHGINSPADLDLSIAVSQVPQMDRVSLAYVVEPEETLQCTVKVATKEFVQTLAPVAAAEFFIDVDVYTPETVASNREPFSTESLAHVNEWLTKAHALAKREFFHLLRQVDIDRLKADS